MGQCISGRSEERERERAKGRAPKSGRGRAPQSSEFERLGIGTTETGPGRRASPVSATGAAAQPKSAPDSWKEELRLKELFDALRTGLVFKATEFTVMPGGISTTGKVQFTIGSNSLGGSSKEQRREGTPVEEADGSSVDSEDEESAEGLQEEELSMSVLKVSLNGGTWSSEVCMQLNISPIVGPFVGRRLSFSWSRDVLSVRGCREGEINVRSLPAKFETESDFCRCCLMLCYHNSITSQFNFEDGAGAAADPAAAVVADSQKVPALSKLTYVVVATNLDAVPASVPIPGRVRQLLYGSQPPVTFSIRMWPSAYASQFSCNSNITVKGGIIFYELVHLLKERFQLPAWYAIKIYHNYKPIPLQEQVNSAYRNIDCFVIRHNVMSSPRGSYCSGLDDSMEGNVTLVVSLIGYDVQSIEVSLEMKLREFDRLLRERFNLRQDSFLIVLSEDDYSPQYSQCNGWKCVYPFSIPESSIRAELRRSFRKLSRRGPQRTRSQRSQLQRSASQRQRIQRVLPSEEFTPQIAKVIQLLSSDLRNFPYSNERFDYSIEELYDSMPMYNMSLDQCGLHPNAIIQVFEVTGPSIPISFRHSSSSVTPSASVSEHHYYETHRTQLANIMDINPNWSIHTFLQYVDAVVSPPPGTKKKVLSMKSRSVSDAEDLSRLALGELLDLWSPAWWPEKGRTRNQLTLRDFNVQEFLLVEKF